MTQEDTALLPNDLSINNNKEPSEEQEDCTTKKKSKWWRFLIVYALTIIMVLARSCDTVLYVRLTYEIQNYIYMLTNLVNVVYVVILAPIVLFQIWRGKITKQMRNTSQLKYIIMAFLDNATNTLQTIPAAFVSGSINTMLSQAVILINIIMSFTFLHTRYNTFHFSGVMLVLCGLIINLYPVFAQEDSGGSGTGGTSTMDWLWILLLFCSNIPQAASNVYKEKCLKKEKLDVWLVNYWVSIWQVLFGIVTSVFVFVPIPQTTSISWADLNTYIWNGIKCSFGVNSIVEGPSPDRCESFPLVFWADIFFNFTYATLELYVFQYGSSTLAVIAAVSRLALSNLFFLLKFIAGEAWEAQLSMFDVVSLVILVLGIVIYSITEEKEASENDRLRKFNQTVSSSISSIIKPKMEILKRVFNRWWNMYQRESNNTGEIK